MCFTWSATLPKRGERTGSIVRAAGKLKLKEVKMPAGMERDKMTHSEGYFVCKEPFRARGNVSL